MEQDVIDKIKASPQFRLLERKRSRLAWSLSALMLGAYYSFVMLVAFFPDVISIRLFEGRLITTGICMGVGLIVFAFILTGIYVYKANTEFDKLSEEIRGLAE